MRGKKYTPLEFLKYIRDPLAQSEIDRWIKVNGITISPKKNFSIMKIWLKDCTIQNPKIINILPQLDINGVLFKKHNPQY